jgi:hypothetical protein
MSNEQIKVQITADGSKVSAAVTKVKKDLGGLAGAADQIGLSWGKLGGIIGGALSIGAAASFLRTVNSLADGLNDMADRMSVSASGLQSLQLAAQQAGGSAEGLNNVLTKMSQTIGDGMAGNKQAVAAFERLGLSVAEISKLKGDQAFRQISEALRQIPNDFERASAAQDIFGKGVKEVGALLAQGGQAIDEVNAKLDAQGARLDDLDIAKIGVMNDELQFQGTVVSNLTTKFLAGLAPAVGAAVDNVAALADTFGGATAAGRAFGITLTAIGSGITAAFSLVVQTLSVVEAAIAKTVQYAIGANSGILDALGRAADAVGLNGIGASLQQAAEAGAQVADKWGVVAEAGFGRAQAAGALAVKSIVDFTNAAGIFDAKASEMEARAAEMAEKLRAAQGLGTGYTAPDNGKEKKGPDYSYGTLRKDNFRNELEQDPTTDPKYLYQQSLNTALAQLASDGMAVQLNIAQVGQASILDSFLSNNDMMIAAEQAKNMTLGDMGNQLASMAMQQGGTIGKIGKAYAIAQTIWSTYTAVMKAMAEVPFPANYAVAAATAAMGVAQLSKIKSTNLGSTSGSISRPSGTGMSASGVTRSVPEGTQKASDESKERSAVQVIIQGNLIETDSTARWLSEVLRDAADNRDMVFFSANSRQAMELAGAAG